MANYYVQKQENSPYLKSVSLEQKEGYIEVYPNDTQVVKLMNFTDKCFLTDDNLLVVPDQVPMSQQEQEAQQVKQQLQELSDEHTKNVNQINDLSNQLATAQNQNEKDAKDKALMQQQIQGLQRSNMNLMQQIAQLNAKQQSNTDKGGNQ